MICVLNGWEWEDLRRNGVVPDCRNHRHLSRRRACERFEDARLADRILAYVYNSQNKRIGLIAQVGPRVIWTRRLGDLKPEAGLVSAQWEMVNAHLKRFQAIIDSGNRPVVNTITLPECRKEPMITRDAAISQTLREHSPCSITARESELNAEGAWRKRQAQRRAQAD